MTTKTSTKRTPVTPAQKQMQTNPAAKLVQRLWLLQQQRRNSQSALDIFKGRFAEDPQYAFEWSDDAFTAASRSSVARLAQHLLVQVALPDAGHDPAVLDDVVRRLTDVEGSVVTATEKATEQVLDGQAQLALSTLLEKAERETLNGARWPASSTSATSNVAKLRLTQAWAELYTALKGD